MKNVKPEDTVDLTFEEMKEWSVEDLEYERERMSKKPLVWGVDRVYYIKLVSVLEETRQKLDTLFKDN